MNETDIVWTGLTWNAASGCLASSEECAFCYAEDLAEQKKGTLAFPQGFKLTLRPHKLREPAALRSPTLIFTNSMWDPFLPEVPDEYRGAWLGAMRSAPRHRYQVLTKHPDEALRFFRRTGASLPPSIWLGVTIGIQRSMWRLDALLELDEYLRAQGCPPLLLFLSCEPLLSALEFEPARLQRVAWAIGGGESGKHAAELAALDQRLAHDVGTLRGEELRQARARRRYLQSRFLVVKSGNRWTPTEAGRAWARKLRDDCATAGTAFFWKQWGGVTPKAGGRLLDGRTHDGMPLQIPGAMPEGYVHRTDADRHKPGAAAPRGQLHLDVLGAGGGR